MTTKPLAKIVKSPKIYKTKELNTGNFANFNLNEYQVFLHLISKLGKLDSDGNYIQPEVLEREHTLTALEFAKVFNLPLNLAYPILKKAVARLMKEDITVFELYKNKPCKVQINVCEKAKYIENEGMIKILFTGSIMPYLAQQVQQKFVFYHLKEIANFGSLYTTRLYELIQDFKDTGTLIKSIEQLREVFAVGNNLSLYTNFKAKTFEHACNEINEKTDYGISFTEIKTGRKVTSIEFSFKKTIVEKRFKPDGSQVNHYIKPKHNSDKIEAAKAIEAPKKPAPTIQKTERMTSLSPIASAIMEDIKNKYGKK
jgi:plasmid replication initiation protein